VVGENAELKKKLEKAEGRQLADLKIMLLNKAESINGIHFIGEIVEVPNAEALKKLCFDIKNEFASGINTGGKGISGYLVVLAANIEGKAGVAVLLDEQAAAAKNLQAPAIIKEQIAPLIKGGGGGQKTLATAGGQDAGQLGQVIERVRKLL
jgi:alanyl-tRNA synthetase